jgi:hypothetical protein
MTENEDVGPFGKEVTLEEGEIGDVIQLQNDEGIFYHTLIISEIKDDEIYVCANSNDSLDRPLSSYDYANLRVIHILGVRYDPKYTIDCFEALYNPPTPPINPNEPNGNETQQGENGEENISDETL